MIFDNVAFTYHSLFSEAVPVLSGIDLTIDPGECIAILGASGSGKTTLIQHFNGLLQPAGGTVRFYEDRSNEPVDSNTLFQRVGLAFQFPENQFFKETVHEEVIYGPENTGVSGEALKQKAVEAFEWVGLDFEKFHTQSPFHLSGGEQRRVAIASILASDPEILILDEPTVGLDKQGIACMESLIRRFHETGKTVILVSHDMDLVFRVASRMLILKKGELIFDGSRDHLFDHPAILEQGGLRKSNLMLVLEKLRAKGIEIPNTIRSEASLHDFLRPRPPNSFQIVT